MTEQLNTAESKHGPESAKTSLTDPDRTRPGCTTGSITGSTCTAGRIMIAVRCVEQIISQLIWSGSVLDPFVVADFWADPFKMKCSWVTCSRLYKSSGFSYCTFAFDDICNATLKVKCEMGFNSNSQWPVSESLGYQWRLILVQIRDAHTGEH